MGAPEREIIADSADQLVLEVLAEYGELTRQSLKDYLPERQVGSYLTELIGDYPQRRGKMLRPSLCIATARAFGAPANEAVASAVSIELLHNALLIHDDIQDGSDERRGAPTLHELHGMPLALNAGDALALLSVRPLKDNIQRLGLDLGLRVFEETERVAWETTEGQALELGWRRDNRVDITDEDYLTMVLKKTCWLTTIHPLRVGCLIGTRGRAPLDPLIRLGFFMGAAFQIQDDLLNLTGGEGYGKELNGDLLEGKRTLMLIHALMHAEPDQRRKLKLFLENDRAKRDLNEVTWVRELLDDCGALERAKVMAKGLAGAALYEFNQIFASTKDSRDRQFIFALITWLLRRMH
jgi:geranylgeranyl diphosphate synthase, type II